METEEPGPTIVIAIIGSATEPVEEITAEMTRELGALLMERGCRIVTGGLGGVMAEVSRGARQSSAWREGQIVGIIPGYDRGAANPYVDVVIASGAGIARNVMVVASASAVIAVGGGAGTLSEIALAWQLGKPIVGLTAIEGWGSKLVGEQLDHRHDARIMPASSAREAVELALTAARAVIEPGMIGSGWLGGKA